MALEKTHKHELAKLGGVIAELQEQLQKIALFNDKAVEKRLGKFINALDGADEAGRMALADALERDLTTLHEKLWGEKSKFREVYRKAMAKAASAGKLRLARTAAEAVGKESLAKLSERDVASVIKSSRDAYEMAAKNLTVDAVAEVRRLVTEELLRGSGSKELARRLMKSGHIADLELPGRKLRAETRAEMIARTEPRRISEASYRSSAAEVEPEPAKRLYQWVSVMGFTSGDDSLRRHGLVMSEPEWQSHDFGDGFFRFPPLRPNDRCSVIFLREQWLEESAKEALKAPAGTDGRRIVQTSEEAERTKLLGV